MSSPYTCITCRVAFQQLDFQRQHYKSDWHRYNLKRKVAELPPITAESFQNKVIAQRNKNYLCEDYDITYCNVCRKRFYTQNQYQNHLNSKKHKEKTLKHNDTNGQEDEINKDISKVETLKESDIKECSMGKAKTGECSLNMDIDLDVESVNSDEWLEDAENPVRRNTCLFCNHHSRSLVKNLKHMTEAHSFFVPDPEYCIDIPGLIEYLGKLIYYYYMCIWCSDNGKTFRTVEAAQKHMIDKGHCKVLHGSEIFAECADFYDYSSSYPDANTAEAEDEIEIPELDDSGYQLILPSGSVIGHRSLMRYYKQNLNPNRSLAVSKDDKIKKVLSMYRALGWKNDDKEILKKKITDIKYMQRIKSKYYTKLQIKANNLQNHYRPQVNF